MPKHIDVGELKEWVENWFEKNRYYHPYSKSNDIPIPELYDILEQMPTADVVEVVRCDKCKWQRKELLPSGHYWYECRYGNEGLGFDGEFCSEGERREDEH